MATPKKSTSKKKTAVEQPVIINKNHIITVFFIGYVILALFAQRIAVSAGAIGGAVLVVWLWWSFVPVVWLYILFQLFWAANHNRSRIRPMAIIFGITSLALIGVGAAGWIYAHKDYTVPPTAEVITLQSEFAKATYATYEPTYIPEGYKLVSPSYLQANGVHYPTIRLIYSSNPAKPTILNSYTVYEVDLTDSTDTRPCFSEPHDAFALNQSGFDCYLAGSAGDIAIYRLKDLHRPNIAQDYYSTIGKTRIIISATNYELPLTEAIKINLGLKLYK